MLRNLADAEKERLLECFNTIWDTGVLPESWLVAVVTRILKSRKPAIALSSYRPVSLTSAACKAMERVALARLGWIAAQLQYFPEQQTGFRRQRCTADSISDVVATLEDAKATGDVAMLVLLDVKSAFDGLPHAVIEACLDRLGQSGCLRRFISAFLTGRTFRVRVGQELSEPRDITTGVPQGSVLSLFLFNMALAGLPASLPADPRFPVRCSIYADDVALWTRGPRKFMPSIRCSLQGALDAWRRLPATRPQRSRPPGTQSRKRTRPQTLRAGDATLAGASTVQHEKEEVSPERTLETDFSKQKPPTSVSGTDKKTDALRTAASKAVAPLGDNDSTEEAAMGAEATPAKRRPTKQARHHKTHGCEQWRGARTSPEPRSLVWPANSGRHRLHVAAASSGRSTP
ncbi:hypothetical protein HPB49_008669 [Dermacentor silvarum]|uniref:Uncharacterized protein n=1 Tax=Dermacentor silvarum TaxID=543639 RepID=A0ACB8CQS4_DERSI|nr:hypothetical protein HPB49_008669 [Dermacentor silvarum]